MWDSQGGCNIQDEVKDAYYYWAYWAVEIDQNEHHEERNKWKEIQKTKWRIIIIIKWSGGVFLKSTQVIIKEHQRIVLNKVVIVIIVIILMTSIILLQDSNMK